MDKELESAGLSVDERNFIFDAFDETRNQNDVAIVASNTLLLKLALKVFSAKLRKNLKIYFIEKLLRACGKDTFSDSEEKDNEPPMTAIVLKAYLEILGCRSIPQTAKVKLAPILQDLILENVEADCTSELCDISGMNEPRPRSPLVFKDFEPLPSPEHPVKHKSENYSEKIDVDDDSVQSSDNGNGFGSDNAIVPMTVEVRDSPTSQSEPRTSLVRHALLNTATFQQTMWEENEDEHESNFQFKKQRKDTLTLEDTRTPKLLRSKVRKTSSTLEHISDDSSSGSNEAVKFNMTSAKIFNPVNKPQRVKTEAEVREEIIASCTEKFAEFHQDEENDVLMKDLQLWQALVDVIMNKDSGPFLQPVEVKKFDAYRDYMKEQIDLHIIANKVCTVQYRGDRNELLMDLDKMVKYHRNSNYSQSDINSKANKLKRFYTPLFESLSLL